MCRTLQFGIKRLFDVVVALILILLLTVIPVLIVVPLLIRLTSRGPAVFTQERVGKDGKIFLIYKFRTMLTPEDSITPEGRELTPKERITKVGAILRKTSLDELMQLFNILNGTMSLVGPRPTLPYQVERYTSQQRRRLLVRPGVTGWAQVNGRNDLSWTEKIQYDLEYVDHFSLLFDLKILFRTVWVVFRKEGIEFKREDAITAKSTPAETSNSTDHKD